MTFKKALIPLALLAGSYAGFSQATPVFHPSGPNLTYGEISNGQTIVSSVTNPASAAVSLEKGENEYRFGLLTSVGIRTELGPVDSMLDELDTLSTELDKPSLTVTEANDIINRFDALLKDAGENGYFRFAASAHVPLMPLVITHNALGGSLVLDMNAGLEADLRILDAPMVYNPLISDIETASSLYVKGAVQSELALGYSRPVFTFADSALNGTLYAGVRAKYISMGLRKTLASLTGNDPGTILEDEFNKDLEPNTNITADLGLLWAAEYYRVGATITNITEPEFEYETIGGSCTGLTAGELEVCNLANNFASRISLNETHVMTSQTKLEAAVYTKSRNWVLGMSYDANPAVTPTGTELQYATVSAAYASDSWIPGIRFGYRTNMVGSELSEAMLGFTLFTFLNLDVAYGLESIAVDGSEVPRTMAVNLGLELTF